MNMKLKSILLAATLTVTSCGFLDVEPQVICSETFYNTEEEVQYGLAGVYGVMSNEAFYGNYYSLMCSNIDDLCYYNRPTTTNHTQVYRHDATSTEVYAAWTEIYKGIRNANHFMEAVAQTTFDQDGKYYNEARFLRAYYHFLLAQAWGDVPLKTSAATSVDDVYGESSSQYDVLKWAAEEMEACIPLADSTLVNAPSRISRNTVHGILSRVYLFLAGESVKGADRKLCYGKAMEHSDAVIRSAMHKLNPDYSEVFINMISDVYDTEHRESMWEVDFLGNRVSAESWSNGRIGDLIGLQSSASQGYSSFLCNYSYGQYDGSLKLWDLYWKEDLPDDQAALAGTVTDSRQLWNMPPYNYAGCKINIKKNVSGKEVTISMTVPASTQKAPYIYAGTLADAAGLELSADQIALVDPTTAAGIRNCGKWRRETGYEGVMDSKRLYTGINFPLLRYSDVLLMYAEASLEYEGVPSQAAYDCVKAVRDRAGVSTRPFSEYDADSFRQLVRNERGRELCFEATRKYDLIRWGIFVKEMNEYYKWTGDARWSSSAKASYAKAIGDAVQAKHVYLPVPSVELGVNKNLVQNPLW